MHSDAADEQSELNQELLKHFAKQAKRVPLPVLGSVAVITWLCYDHVERGLLLAWVCFVVATLVFRWAGILLLVKPAYGGAPAVRLRYTSYLAALNGLANFSVLLFFPSLPVEERTIISMVFATMSAGNVATTAGYGRVYLSYALPIMLPLIAIWFWAPGLEGAEGLGYVMAGLLLLYQLLLFSIAKDYWQQFRGAWVHRREQENLNQKLEMALAKEAEANHSKTRFLATASHDLRQPIHTLALFTTALSLRELDPRSMEIVAHLNEAQQALAEQLDALLDISQLDAQVTKAKIRPLSLAALLERLYNEYLPVADGKGLSFQLHNQVDASVQSDSALLERVLRNLLSNALKYTDQGGVELRVAEQDGRCKISINDSGQGIPEAERSKVFDEFYQIGNAGRERRNGLGLGLSIVQRLCRLLEIEMCITDVPTGGTSVQLMIPLTHRNVLPQTPKPDVEPPSLQRQGLRFLVVDDEPSVRVAMQTLLEGLGYQVQVAEACNEALELATQQQPDLLFTDLRLRDGEDGMEVITALRALYPNLPAVLVTGETAPDVLARIHAYDIPTLHKPLQLADLQAIISSCCRQAEEDAA